MSTPPTLEQTRQFRKSRVPAVPQGPPSLEATRQFRAQHSNSIVSGAVASAVDSFKAASADLGAGAVQGLAATNNQLANLFAILDRASTGLSKATGLDRGGAFERISEWFRQQGQAGQALATRMSPNRPGILDDLNRFVGSLPVELPKAASAVAAGGPVLGFAGLGALSEADKGPGAAALGATKGALAGKVFEIAGPLGRLGRAGAVTSGVAAIESATGATPKEALTSGGTTGILAGIVGGPGFRKLPERVVDLEHLRIATKVGEAVEAGKPRIKLKLPAAEHPLVEVSDAAKTAADKAVGGIQPTRVALDNGRVLNLNLNRIRGPEDFKEMQRFLVEEFKPQIDQARRGVVTQVETERMADALGLTVEQLMKRRLGQAFNAEELTAARVLHQSIAKELFDTARVVRSGEATDNVKTNFVNLVALYEASAKQTLGATAEAGRALSAMRIMTGPSRRHLADIRDVMDQFQKSTRGKSVEEFADLVSRLEDPGSLTQAVEAIRKPTFSDKFIEVYINGLLTNPKTHAVNTLSNTLTALWAIPEAYVAGAFGGLSAAAARSAGRPRPERVFLREGNARLFGFLQGAREGLRLAAQVARTGKSTDTFGKIESRRGAVGGTLGKVVRVPGDLLLSADEFFKAIGMRQEIHAAAVRQAVVEGLRGARFRERVVELVQNPSEATREAAIQTARRQTFTEPLGKIGRSVVSFSNSHPLFKLILPFVRTPANIFKFAAKRSPLAPLFDDVRSNLRKGGAARQEELGRLVFGTMAATVAASLAAEEHITGSGPADPETRAAWFAAGNRPYSFRLSTQPGSKWNRWVSFGRLEPTSTLLGVGADFAQVAGHMNDAELDEAAALVLLSFRKNVENKTFLQGLTRLMLATSDPDRYGERFLGSLAVSFIPATALMGEVARQNDPILRRADTIFDHVKARVPGFTTTLPPRRNIWGEPIFLDGGIGPDFISPLYSHRPVPDKATEEALRTGAQLSKPKDVIKGVQLTPMERDKLEEISGRLGKRMIDQLVGDPEYDRLPKAVQRGLIEGLYTRARAVARTKVFETTLTHDPGRYGAVVRKALDEMRGTAGE